MGKKTGSQSAKDKLESCPHMVSWETLDRSAELSEISLLTCRMETIIIEVKIACPASATPGAPRPYAVLALFLALHF